MAHSAPRVYGSDLFCMDDADNLFSEVTGLDLVRQSAYHRLTNDTILGAEGDEDCDSYGYDCTRLAGMPVSQLGPLQAYIAGVLQRDDRIERADVTLTPTQTADGLADVLLSVVCITALGPFTFVKPVSQLLISDLEPAA